MQVGSVVRYQYKYPDVVEIDWVGIVTEVKPPRAEDYDFFSVSNGTAECLIGDQNETWRSYANSVLIYWNGPFTKGDPKNKWIGIVVEKDTRGGWMDYWRVSFLQQPSGHCSLRWRYYANR